MSYRNIKIKIIAAIVLFCLLFASCAKEEVVGENLDEPQNEETNQTEQVNYIAEITMMLKTDDFVMENWPVMQELFKKSGISAIIKTIRPARYIETLNVNLSSGKVYDIMELPPSYAEAADEYIVDALPLINTYAPYYISWINSFPPEMLTALSTPEGEIKIIPLRQQVGTVSAIPFIKKEADSREYDSVSFYTAMTQSGGKFAVPGSTMTMCELMAPMFDTSTEAIYKDGELVYGPLTDEFKAMLLYLNSLYNKKILSDSFFVYTPTNLRYDIQNGTVTAGIFTKDFYEDAYNAGMEPFMFSPVDGASLPGYVDAPMSYAAISDYSGRQNYAMQFINYCFSDEGRRLLNNGVEGLHTTQEENGILSQLEPFNHAGFYQWRNQGLTPEGLPGVYYNTWTQYEKELYELLIPMRKYQPSEDMLVIKLPAAGTNAQSSKVIEGTINPLLNEWWGEFIIGTKSLSSDWNNYIKEIQYAGLDTYLWIHHK